MPHIVTRLCRDCKHTTCVTVCPVDCFYVPLEPTGEVPDQLYISPNECIDCFACIPECPWEAIYEEPEVPEPLRDDIALNRLCDDRRDLFQPAQETDKEPPTGDEVRTNKMKWGLSEEDPAG